MQRFVFLLLIFVFVFCFPESTFALSIGMILFKIYQINQKWKVIVSSYLAGTYRSIDTEPTMCYDHCLTWLI